MKRPLFPCMTGLVLGEAAAISFGVKGGVCAVLLFLLTGVCFLVWQKGQGRFLLLLFSIFFLAGFLLFLRAWEQREPLPGKTLPLSGQISGRITFLQVDEEGEYDITLEEVRFLPEGEKETVPVRKNCRVFHLTTEMGSLMPGDQITGVGEMTALAAPTNPGEFNSEVYYQSKGISCQFFADSFQKTGQERFCLERIACRVRMAVAGVYDRTLGTGYAALLEAMVLGDKKALSEEQELRYEENGVAHLLSVSGLHVSIMAGSWFRFLRRRKLPYAPACAGGVFLLLFYGCLTGFGSSILRAVLMYAVYLGAEYFGAQYDMTSAMSLAGILMLFDSPWRLLEGGCQMSFAAIFAIGYVLPWVEELAEKRKREEEGRIRRFSGWRKRAADAFLSSVVISAVTLPVVLRIFYTFSPYSILINLLVIPCMTPMMVSGIVAGLAGVFLLPDIGPGGLSLPGWAGEILTRVLFLPAVGVLGFLDFFLEHMRQLPGAVLLPGCPSLPEMAALYALEGALLFIWYRRWWKTGIRAGLFLALVLFFLPSDRKLRVTMLDVGQGDGILVEMPGGESVLIDGGSTSRSGVGQYVIAPALKYYGIAEIDYMIATHMDADHISGLSELLEMGYPVRHVLLSAVGSDEEQDTFAALAKEKGAQVVMMERGDGIRFPDGAHLRCMHPYDGFETEDKNAASLVFHLEYGDFDALFTGDLEASGEEAVCTYVEKNGQKPAGKQSVREKAAGKQKERRKAGSGWEILKVAHHGSGSSTGDTFLSHFLPQAALISVGEKNRYGHPDPETLKRLADCGADICMTMESGAIFVETDGENWTMSAFR